MASSRSFASFLLCALLLASPISATFSFDGGKSAAAAGKAVDMEWRPATATWYGEAEGDGSDGGACGYGTLVDVVPMKARVGSVSPVLFKDGEGCGACYKVKCLDHTVCSRRAVTVIVTDECPGGLCAFGRTHFDLSGAAFSRMAVAGAGGHLRDRGEISVVYTRTACKYGGKNIAFHVNEGSTNFWLSLLVEFEDGEGDIGSMQIKQIAAVVSLQLWTATLLRDAGWLKIVTVAYFFGSFLNHNLFLAIHELSHNLAFTTPYLNRWLGIFANLPIGVPMSITFQKYHLEHHRFQGVDGIDMDIPGQAEAHAVKNAISKSVWVVLQLFFYALRPLFLKPKPPGLWEFTNLTIQIALDVSLVYFYGWKSLAYLILSTFVGGGMHPMAGHFISEHYVFNPDQETYSYYGPLNLMAWHVGYHNEHHDFPRIPGTRLHKVKEIAPEYYDNLKSYKSWSQVIYMYIMDQTVGPFSRMKRKAPKKDS